MKTVEGMWEEKAGKLVPYDFDGQETEVINIEGHDVGVYTEKLPKLKIKSNNIHREITVRMFAYQTFDKTLIHKILSKMRQK